MAAEKKASEKKVSKKVIATAKKEPKTAKKLPKDKPLLIKVPQGGQVIRSFNLTPSLPVHGQATNWQLVDPTAKKPKDIEGIRVSFDINSSSTEQYFERAVLIIKMQQNAAEEGVWRFAADGVVVNPKHTDVNHDVAVEILDQGMTLVAYVHEIGDTKEEIRFSYVASFTEKKSGEIKVYESRDPGVGIGRP